MWLYVNSFRLCVGTYLVETTESMSNLAKYGHGPPDDGFKGDQNM